MSTDVSEEEIRNEVDRISRILGKHPPEEIVVETSFITKDARFEKDGDRLVLQGGWGLKDIQDQIIWTYLNRDLKSHPNPLVRNPHRLDMVLTILIGIGFVILIVSFPSIPFLLRVLSILGLTSSHLVATYLLGSKKQAYAEFVADYMRKTKYWSEKEIENFLNGAHLMGVWISILFSLILFVAGISFAFVFNF
ncbi:MAG: hypothetical protein GF411_09410 [Candidatus Lokiarchaeota archaeon]|nr:hypothetical protein [Candidatus Lokiarchaeota archaeon]